MHSSIIESCSELYVLKTNFTVIYIITNPFYKLCHPSVPSLLRNPPTTPVFKTVFEMSIVRKEKKGTGYNKEDINVENPKDSIFVRTKTSHFDW